MQPTINVIHALISTNNNNNIINNNNNNNNNKHERRIPLCVIFILKGNIVKFPQDIPEKLHCTIID